MGWPWKRFEKFYEAFAKRKIVEGLHQRKLFHINALYSNPNYDSEEVNRDQIVEKLEDQFDDAIHAVWTGQTTDEEEIDYKNDPFFAPIEKGLPPMIDIPAGEEHKEDSKSWLEDVEIDQ